MHSKARAFNVYQQLLITTSTFKTFTQEVKLKQLAWTIEKKLQLKGIDNCTHSRSAFKKHIQELELSMSINNNINIQELKCSLGAIGMDDWRQMSIERNPRQYSMFTQEAHSRSAFKNWSFQCLSTAIVTLMNQDTPSRVKKTCPKKHNLRKICHPSLTY